MINFNKVLYSPDAIEEGGRLEGYTSSVSPEDFAVKSKGPFDYENGEVILEVKHLKQYFKFGRGEFKYNKAVHDVSFKVYKGEVFGLVGESGCGKTTTGRSIIGLYQITSGDVWFKGERIAAGTRWNEKEIKFTKIRLKESLKIAKAEYERDITSLFTEYNDVFGEKFSISKIEEEVKEAVSDTYAEKEKFLKKYVEISDGYSEKTKELISNAEAICSGQTEKIKAAKKDNNRNDKARRDLRTKIQMIFQDPIASLNPRMTVRDIISEGLVIHGCKDKEFITKEVNRVLEYVGLVPEHANRYPHEFSGGQRQRIGIARAIIMNPDVIIADEPVSALDVSIQAQVINLLNEIRNNLDLTVLFIAHNLSVVKYFCDRIAVMYFGNLVELATSEELFAHPVHPYTKSLLSAVPHPDPNVERNRTRVSYNPGACHDYSTQKPTLREITPGHFVLCNDEEEERYLKEIYAPVEGD